MSKIGLKKSIVLDSAILGPSKELYTSIVSSLRGSSLADMANIEKHRDGFRVSLRSYPFAYVDIYSKDGRVLADHSRNAQTVFPGLVKRFAKQTGLSEEKSEIRLRRFFNWIQAMKGHSGGLIPDIPKLKVVDSKVMDAGSKWYIMERDNPQLPKPYYKVYGKLSKKRADELTKVSYGSKRMIPFDSEEAMKDKVEDLRKSGFSITDSTSVK